MQKAREVLAVALLAVGVLVGLAAVVVMFQISAAVKHADAELGRASDELGQVLEHVDGTVASAQTGLDESYKVLHAGRVTVDNVNRAAIDERMYFEQQLPGLMARADGVLGNIQTATADMDPLVRSATARVDGLAPLEADAADVLAGATGVTRGVGQLAADPRIPEAIGNLDAATAQLAVTSRESAETMASVKAMAADGQEEVHHLTHPRPLVSIANWTLKVVHAIGGFF